MADSDEPMSVCSNDRSARAALSIMRQWQWGYYDRDGERVSDSMSLSKVVSRLAMEGQAAPKQDILKLLCSDVLRARGDYQWRKFSDGEYYELSGSAADVPSARWQVLFDLIDVSEKRLGKLDEPQPKIVLLMLGNGEWPAFNWDHYQGEFLTLQTSGYASSFTPEYFEETYSVTNLEIYLPTDHSDLADSDPTPLKQPIVEQDKGGRPPAANWELAALELAGRYYKGDFKPATKADVQRELAAYLAEDDVHPSPSTLAMHTKPIFEAFQAWEGD